MINCKQLLRLYRAFLNYTKLRCNNTDLENLQYYDIYHIMQYMFKFNLQIFTGVHCGFLVSRGRWLLGLDMVER